MKCIPGARPAQPYNLYTQLLRRFNPPWIDRARQVAILSGTETCVKARQSDCAAPIRNAEAFELYFPEVGSKPAPEIKTVSSVAAKNAGPKIQLLCWR